MVVYADELFLVNFISAYVLIYLIGKAAAGIKIKKWRHITAAAVGAAVAVVIFTISMPVWLAYIFRTIFAIIMVCIAFFEQKRQISGQLVWLAVTSVIIVGAMTLLSVLTGGTTGIIIKSGIIYFDLPLKIFLPLFAVSYIAVALTVRFISVKRAKRSLTLAITHNGKTIVVPAIFDSGNLLREPITRKCVSIVEWEEIKKLLGEEYARSEVSDCAEELKLWAVPYRTVGKQSGIIFAFLADSVKILEEGKTVEKTFIGIYEGSLSKNKEYRALVNAALV